MDNPIYKEEHQSMKKHSEKFSAFDTNMGKYSSSKIPQWRLGHIDLLEYLDVQDDEWDDPHYEVAPA
jgi:hypothetical protein